LFEGEFEFNLFEVKFEATKLRRCELLNAVFLFAFGDDCSIELTSQPKDKQTETAIIKIESSLQTSVLFFADIAVMPPIIQLFLDFNTMFNHVAALFNLPEKRDFRMSKQFK